MVQPSGAELIFTEFNEKDCQDISFGQWAKRKCQWKFSSCHPPLSLRPVRCRDKNGNYKPHMVIYTNDFMSVVRNSGL